MAYFPFMVEVRNREILILGGGKSAWQKVRSLSRFGANLTVLTANLCPELATWMQAQEQITESLPESGEPADDPAGGTCGQVVGRSDPADRHPAGQRPDMHRQTDQRERTDQQSEDGIAFIETRDGEAYRPGQTHQNTGSIRWIPQDFHPVRGVDVLDGFDVVIAATGDRRLNRRIALLARERGLPVNTVDDKEYCDFIFPAVTRREHYSVAVCTDGKSPLMARRIREDLERVLPDVYDETVGHLGEVRQSVLRQEGSQEKRVRIFQNMADRYLQKDGDEPAPETVKIGTRGSRLAMIQTGMVIEQLERRGIPSEPVILRTKGDRMPDRPLQEFGGKAVFVSDFEKALLDGTIDLAVHSAKDMPAVTPEGLQILACLKRGDPADVLVSRKGQERARIRTIGTGSLRRKVQMEWLIAGLSDAEAYCQGDRDGSESGQYSQKLHVEADPGRSQADETASEAAPGGEQRKDSVRLGAIDLSIRAECRHLRGNVPTRLQKLRDGECDALILSAAGLQRLGLDAEKDLVYQRLNENVFLPAAGQGIIAVEGRKGSRLAEVLKSLSDPVTEAALEAERRFMRGIGAGCHEAVGAWARWTDGLWHMDVMRVSGDCVRFREGGVTGADVGKLADMLAESVVRESSGIHAFADSCQEKKC